MQTVLTNSLFVGLVYALVAVGLVVAYRGSQVINFANGETGMLAAFFFIDMRLGTTQSISLAGTDHGVLWALPLALLLGAAVGAGTELIVVRPLRQAPRIRALVGTAGVALLIITYASRRWGGGARSAPPLIDGEGVRVAGLQITPQELLILVVTTGLLVGLWALYRFTSFGLRMRAVALDPYAAGLAGINVNGTSMATWALAGALSALAAILIAPLVAANVFFMTELNIRSLAAALVGGLTNVSGAVIAAILIALAEGFIAFQSPIAGITDVAIAVFVLVLMLVRPQGLVRAAY